MKIKFEDINTATALADVSQSTFLFLGSEYPFAAAKLYSYYLSKILSVGVDFQPQPKGFLEGNAVHLFGTVEENSTFILKKERACRLIPMKQGTLLMKKDWGKYVSEIFVVEVSPINPSEMVDVVRSWMNLLEIPFKDKYLKSVTRVYEPTYAGVLQCIEYASFFDGLVEGEAVMGGYPEEVSYNTFKETFLYKGALDMSLAVAQIKDPMPYVTRLINDLSILAALAAEEEAGTPAEEIAPSYGFNVFLLKNRLLPRVKTLGLPRILRVLGRLAAFQDRWLQGKLVAPKEQLAALMLLETY